METNQRKVMTMKLKQTISISDLLVTGGIFKKIQATTGQPFEWLTSELALELDKILYLERSGDKYLSPFYQRLLDYKNEGNVIDELQIIANDLITKYANKWNRLYDAIHEEYDPIENYNMVEVETPDIEKKRTKNESTKISTTNTSESSTHGFNSATAVPVNEGEVTSVVEGDADDNELNETETETGTRELTRHGNIGVTTSQQMLESEIKLRNSYTFVDGIMHDVDVTMCLLVY